jgi:phage terminase Nu1 subunit (DNA packaging protein)
LASQHSEGGEEDRVALTPDQKRRQRLRSIAIAAALVAMVVMFYVMTMIRIGGNIANRSM